jgi:hypothetical protein
MEALKGEEMRRAEEEQERHTADQIEFAAPTGP